MKPPPHLPFAAAFCGIGIGIHMTPPFTTGTMPPPDLPPPLAPPMDACATVPMVLNKSFSSCHCAPGGMPETRILLLSFELWSSVNQICDPKKKLPLSLCIACMAWLGSSYRTSPKPAPPMPPAMPMPPRQPMPPMPNMPSIAPFPAPPAPPPAFLIPAKAIAKPACLKWSFNSCQPAPGGMFETITLLPSFELRSRTTLTCEPNITLPFKVSTAMCACAGSSKRTSPIWEPLGPTPPDDMPA
mmetsp:Transcript_91805/g.259236  ORF Transcript_91805/g.259236 Transcript_91805/m.259236 type:complete len:243 (+) Transcript_91805:126-854(+)